MLGIIKRNFKYLTIPTFILLYKNMVRSYLDYCSSVWSPYSKQKGWLWGNGTEKGDQTIARTQRPELHWQIKSMQIAYTTLQTYTGRYDRNIAPMLPSPHSYVTQEHDTWPQRLEKIGQDMIYANSFLLTEWSIFGILYRIMLSMLIP